MKRSYLVTLKCPRCGARVFDAGLCAACEREESRTPEDTALANEMRSEREHGA